MGYLAEQIENAVQEKRGALAKKLIQSFIRENPTKANILLASDWHRRLSQYRDGLKLAMRLNPFDPEASDEVKLKVAEFLSILGANHFALKLIENFKPISSNDCEVAAGIFYSGGRYEQALKYFEHRVNLLSEKNSYNSRLSQLSCADCLSHMSRFGDALLICRNLLAQTQEPLLQAILKQALGEYLTRSGNIKDGLRWLKEAEKEFPGEKVTYDHALLFRWLGYAYVKNGQKQKGQKYLKDSTQIIQRTGLREDVWFENLRLQSNLKILPEKTALRLKFLPGLRAEFQKIAEKRKLQVGKQSAKLKIHLENEEFQFQAKNYLGIPLELRLLAYLAIAGDWGLGFEVLKISLWPNEAHSYLQLEDRTIQLIKRLRKFYKIEIQILKRRVYLKSADMVFVSAEKDTRRLPNQLEKLGKFSTKDLMRIYCIGRTQAVEWLKKFEQWKLVKKSGAGSATSYKLR